MAADGLIVLGLDVSQTQAEIQAGLDSILNKTKTKEIILKTAIEKAETEKKIDSVVKSLNKKTVKMGVEVDARSVNNILAAQQKIASTQAKLNAQMKEYRDTASKISLTLNKDSWNPFSRAVKDGDFTKANEILKSTKKQIEAYNAAVQKMNSDTSVSGSVSSIVEQFSKLKDVSTETQKRVNLLKANLAQFENADNTQKKLSAYKRLQTMIESLSDELRTLSSTEKSQSSDLSIKKKIDDATRNLEHNNHRIKLLTELENNLEGFSGSVKRVVSEGKRGSLKGIVGTVSQILTVDAKYALAIETALGAAMQNIVVETEENAKNAISSLKRENAGRATFLPIETIKGKTLNEQGLSNCEGFIGAGNEIVKYDAKYAEIVKWLLGRIAFVDNLNNATALAKKFGYRFKAVTLDGQVINAGGSLTGGSAASKTGVLTRKFEIEKLSKENENIQNQIKQFEEEIATVNEQLSSAEAYLSGAKAELSVLSEDKIKYSAEQKRLDLSIEEIEVALDQLDAEKMECAGKISAINVQARELETRLLDSKKAKENAETRIAELSGGQTDTSVKAEELSQKSTDLKFKILALKKDIETISSEILRLNAENEEAVKRAEALNQQKNELVNANDVLKNKIVEAENARVALVDSNTKCDQTIALMTEKRTECEQKIDEIRKNERSQFDEREKLTGEITRLEERKISVQKEHDNLIFKLYTEYELDRAQAEAIAEPIDHITEAQSQLSQLKSKIRALGAINVDAIE